MHIFGFEIISARRYKAQQAHLEYLIRHGFETLNASLNLQGNIVMSTLQDLQDAINQSRADLAAERAEIAGLVGTIQTSFADVKAQLEALQAQVASGALISQADLDAAVDAIRGFDADVKNLSDVVAPPAPAPAPAPEPVVEAPAPAPAEETPPVVETPVPDTAPEEAPPTVNPDAPAP